MRNAILFEQHHRGDMWRLEVASYEGRTFMNWRRWYQKDGSWKPTREGVTIRLERLGELEGALASWRKANS
jgi:hypothetical protein